MSIQTILEIEPGRQVHLPSLLTNLIEVADSLAVAVSAPTVSKEAVLPIAERLAQLAALVRVRPA